MLLFQRESNPKSGTGDVFRYPLEPCPQIAVLSDRLRLSSGQQHLPENKPFDAASLGVETIAAPIDTLLKLQDWWPMFPLVAFTTFRNGLITDWDRETLWRRFEVPVFEQLLDDSGRVIARECEAHSGLHLEPGLSHGFSGSELTINGKRTGLNARTVDGLCECGVSGLKLVRAGHSSAETFALVDDFVQRWLKPPSTASTWPVTNFDAVRK